MVPATLAAKGGIRAVTEHTAQYDYDLPGFKGRQEVVSFESGASFVLSEMTHVCGFPHYEFNDGLLVVRCSLEGRVIEQLSGDPEPRISGPGFLLAQSPADQSRSITILPGAWRGCTVFIHPSRLKMFGVAEAISAEIRAVLGSDAGVGYAGARSITRAMARVVQDMLLCTYTGALRRTYLLAKAMELVCCAADAFAKPSANEKVTPVTRLRIRRALDHIDSQLDRNLTLANVASAVGMSRSGLAKAFRASENITFFDYVRTRRLEKAWELLDSGSYRVADAATSVGYKDPRRFRQAFRSRYGCAPQSVRLRKR